MLSSRIEDHVGEIAQTAATLVSDGWSSIQNRPIINFLLIVEGETIFLDAVDTSGKAKDVAYISGLLSDQIDIYRSGQGLFSRPMAVAAAKENVSSQNNGGFRSELQKVVVRVLSQVSSAAACQCNWSTFDFIHTKKCNRMDCSRVKDIVFVHCNLRFIVDRLESVIREDEWSSDSDDDI